MKRFLYISVILALTASCKCASEKPMQEEQQPAQEQVQAPLDSTAAVQAAKVLPEEPVFDIVTSLGVIKVRLFKDTPRHRNNFEKLALSGYYDSLLFHRVIPAFMIQGGDPFTRDSSKVALYGQGGPDYTLPAEILSPSGDTLHRHVRGALAAARRGDMANPLRESSGSQFYLVQDPENCVHLDGAYTVFGETVAGFNVIDRIAGVKRDRYDRPLQDVRILAIRPNEEWNKNMNSGTEFAKE